MKHQKACEICWHMCVYIYIYFKSAQNEEIWNTQSSFLAGVLVTVSKAHSFGSLYPKPSWSNMVKMHVFFVIFRLPNINISSHRNTERCKRYSASLILFGLKILVLCSGEYIEILEWKFWKRLMKTSVLYYTWSQGSALLCWTQQ